jgi:hypothetical protein
VTPLPFQAIQNRRAPQREAGGVAPALPNHDARWVLAARAMLAATPPAQAGPGGSDAARERLVGWAGRHGIQPVHARAIIAMAEDASARGGLGPEDADRIARLPAPARPGGAGARLGAWLSVVLAVLACAAAALAAARFL